MSRARLGLYVFGRRALRAVLRARARVQALLFGNSTKLAIAADRVVPALATRVDEKVTPYLVSDTIAMGTVVNQLALKWQQEQMQAHANATQALHAPLGVMNDDEDDRGAQEYRDDVRCPGRGSVTPPSRVGIIDYRLGCE